MVYRAATVVMLVLALVMTGCTGGPGGNSTASGGTLRIAQDVDIVTFDPRLSTNTTEVFTNELVFSQLVSVAPDGSIQPELAQTWEQPNPTTWVFHLKSGVKFHDGSALTATDVKYTFDTILDKSFGSKTRSSIAIVKSVTAEGNNTVKIELSEPHGSFLYQLTFGIVPKAVVEKAGAAAFAKNPVGSGPFQFVRHLPANEIVFKSFPNYFGGKPALNEVQLKIIPDANVRAMALESGDVDVIQYPMSIEALQRLEKNTAITVKRTAGSSILYLGFNHTDETLKDRAVRQALCLAIDRAGIISSIWLGVADPAISVLPPGNFALNTSVPTYTFDLEKARQTLTTAGWVAGADGIRAKDGKKLSVTLMTHSEDRQRVQAAEYIQNAWQKIGVDAKVVVKDFAAFQADQIALKYQTCLVGFSRMFEPDYAMYQKFVTGAGQNWFGYKNPDLDALLKQARTEQDPARRVDMYKQAQTKLAEDAVWGYVLWSKYLVAYRNNVKGVEPNGIKITFADSVAKISVDKAAAK